MEYTSLLFKTDLHEIIFNLIRVLNCENENGEKSAPPLTKKPTPSTSFFLNTFFKLF